MASPAGPEATLDQLLQAATGHHLAGRLDQAGAGYIQVLARHPDHPGALHRLGILRLQEGRIEAARELLARATALDPSAWRSHCALGRALAALGRTEEAAASFRRAAELEDACLEAYLGIGAAYRDLGRTGEALTAFHRAAALAPERADILNDLGIALQDAGRMPEAIAAFRRAVALQDEFPVAHSNLGNALLLGGQLDPALDQLNRTVTRWPDRADGWYNLGCAAFAAGRYPRAADAYRRALALQPDLVAAGNNLGNTLQALGRPEEALAAYRAVLAQAPDFIDAHNNASAAARSLGRMDLAADLLREAAARAPHRAVTFGNLGTLCKDVGLMDEAIASFRRALELDPGDRVSHSNLVYSLCFVPGMDGPAILRATRDWERAQAGGIRPGPDHPNRPDPHRRLRIGYVSPDFREHCLSLFTLPLLAHHDHEQFEIVCYSSAPRPDAITRRIAGHADLWRDVARLDDARLADQVRADRIDILVDLTMHMANGRPLLFARKPAPVQVAWLAYPGTTGLSAMDYRLTDPYLDPPGEHGDWYSETSVRLPDTFWCYDPLAAGPDPGPLPARAAGHITFGSLNNFCKVTPAVLDLWARVMGAVPASRLLLLAQPGRHRQRVLERLDAAGIEPGRVTFAPFQPRAEYLALHRQVDLGLDTFPYNGHTTSLDAFWMGVPVVTRVGDTVVGRAGWSQLCNLDLRELAAWTDEDFVRIAVDLSRDLDRLAGLRASLRTRMEASPLMDGARFAWGLEAACRAMWQRWCSDRVV